MFKKVITPKNSAAKVSMVLAIIGAAFLHVVGMNNIPMTWLAQALEIALFVYALYIFLAFLTTRYTVVIESVSGAAEDGEGAYDFIIYEFGARRYGKRERKVCHVSVKHIEFIRIVDAENKKTVAKERRELDRYTYDTQFAAARRIEVVIKNGGEEASMLLTYDEDVLNALLATGVRKR